MYMNEYLFYVLDGLYGNECKIINVYSLEYMKNIYG